jgi:hypothetical protein
MLAPLRTGSDVSSRQLSGGRDIFHGIVFRHHLIGHAFLAPAEDVDRITERSVYLSVDAAATGKYERIQPMHVERLGLKGLFFWRHLGWTDSSE